MSFVSTLFLEAFTLTFLAEWGDRSQLTTIVLAARENVYGVVLGGVLGHALCTGIAVIGGKLVATQISVRTGMKSFCINFEELISKNEHSVIKSERFPPLFTKIFWVIDAYRPYACFTNLYPQTCFYPHSSKRRTTLEFVCPPVNIGTSAPKGSCR